MLYWNLLSSDYWAKKKQKLKKKVKYLEHILICACTNSISLYTNSIKAFKHSSIELVCALIELVCVLIELKSSSLIAN